MADDAERRSGARDAAALPGGRNVRRAQIMTGEHQMSVGDDLSYGELTTQTELVSSSQLARSAAFADLDAARRFRDVAQDACIQ